MARAAELVNLVPVPRRSDARRSYQRLVTAATEAFETVGMDVPLDEIARRAGVGNATLYRHFPTRHALVVACSVGEVEALCAQGDELAATCSPGDALSGWLLTFVEHVTRRQGLAAALMAGDADGCAVIAACYAAIEATGAALLQRAQQAGSVRPEVRSDDLIRLVNAVAMAAGPEGSQQVERLLGLVLDGIRR
jgi:AcrR family transcriptional regulator